MTTIKSNYQKSTLSLYLKDVNTQDSFEIVAPIGYVVCADGEINAIAADRTRVHINYQNDTSISIEIESEGY